MSLSAGTKLGPYEIVEQIGAGGMGEVYRARDTRLGRDVAVKVSQEQFSERFSREARAVAALNHPNICTLYDVGPNYLVMEYIEGEAPRGPLPPETAIEYARQIAAALEVAHEKGIVHRDLKPGNIKIKPDGTVKVLDFGLAKVAHAESGATPEDSPTLSMAATQAGVVLGTAAYMAPEQARGKVVDKRADIWSFGVVLYEMLTGKRLFRGEDVTETLAAVVMKDPNFEPIPAQLRPLLEWCLEKDPKKRLHDIGDARRLLDAKPVEVAPSVGGSQKRTIVPWAIAAIAVASAAGLAWMRFTAPIEAQAPVKFQIPAIINPNTRLMFRISPNGRLLAFTDTRDRRTQLFVRPLDSLEARALPGTENAQDIFWSPDSSSIGFFADGKLKRVGIKGELPQALCNSEASRGGAWSSAGVILFAPTPTDSLYRIPESGGTPERVTPKPGAGEGHRYPEFLPDGKRFLFFLAADDPELNGIYVSSMDGLEPVRILPEGTNVAFVPDRSGESGRLFFRREGTLMEQSFDPQTLKLAGGATSIAEGIRNGAQNIFWAEFAATQDILAYQTGGNGANNINLTWLDRAGKRTTAIDSVASAGRLSPDGLRVAFRRTDPRSTAFDSDLWIQELGGARGAVRLTTSGSTSFAWSQDGKSLVYALRTPVTSSLYRIESSGAAKPELIGSLGINASVMDWSPDGKTILYSRNADRGGTLMLVSLEGDHKPVPYLNTQYSERQGRFSPDGRWIAYQSDESGRPEVYVQALPATTAKFPISSGGGSAPKWRRDGKELYFMSLDGKLMAVPVTPGPAFSAGTPHVLLEQIGDSTVVDYEPTIDGQRFLLGIQAADNTAAPPITVVLNWQAGLKK